MSKLTSMSGWIKSASWFVTGNIFGALFFGLFLDAWSKPIRDNLYGMYSAVAHREGWMALEKATQDLSAADDTASDGASELRAAMYHAGLSNLEKASSYGIPAAQRELGQYLCVGRAKFITPNKARGRYLIEKAAEAGDERAQRLACQTWCNP